ncbi:GGDEF domain-containing protein [Marinomonas posidonica]|uniref:diguanylate cyclase n=1 Tax=Marinomonas posidonica (strain CECT 7376 / NCIMB 14433 / IVIA-Po-181) TaxID=491952 RepID=F6D0Q5_MARPP|nr:GGDEF domain-containing protein [Marinomonas posidonica]AEF55937.1 diguanylate cyclase [Marinomonas posidonica IVIA-Po-181]
MTPVVRHLLRTLGRAGLVSFLTVSAILISIVLDVVLASLFGFTLDIQRDVFMIIVIASIVTPVLSWYLVGLLLRVDTMEQKMTRLASTDSLTLVKNRGYFHKISLKALQHKFSMKDVPMAAFFVLDLDSFKEINDAHGHLCGDRVLVKFADILRALFKKPNVVGRLGGDEFAVLLTNATEQDAHQFAQEILNQVRKTLVDTESGQTSFTVSIGIAMFSGYGEQTFEKAFKVADKALYQAKGSGRDEYVVLPLD